MKGHKLLIFIVFCFIAFQVYKKIEKLKSEYINRGFKEEMLFNKINREYKIRSIDFYKKGD